MLVAVVDIGSNSTRLLVADVKNGAVTEQLEHRSTVTRLGSGVDEQARLSEEGMQRVYDTLEGYGAAIERHGATKRLAVLTSAVRDADNGEQFADTVKTRYGLEPHVLTGEQEATLTFRGATSERAGSDNTPTLVIDIGGGSTELVIGVGQEPQFHVSTQAGVVRQTERHLHSDPPSEAELEALERDVRAVIEEGVPREHRSEVRRAVAVAGTATSLGAIAQALDPYDSEKVHGYVLTAEEIAEIRARLASIPLDERRQTKGLHPDRAPTIVAGILIIQQVLDLFGLEAVEASEHDILRGAALALSS